MKHSIELITKFMFRKTAFCVFIVVAVISVSNIQAADLTTGMSAPDFVFTATSTGESQKLSDYKGKPVTLHFWTTWCGPCIRELPLISEFTESNAGSIAVLAVNCGERDNTVRLFLSKNNINLNLVMDKNNSISNLYNINAIPQTWMIDENGVIRSIQVGSYSKKGLNRDVAMLLKK
ncbi:MAG: redoxin family protein [Treponema sp.]|jgi:peroxiredoxin|nr:redoxin family protein [Treponema sp.]